VKRLLLATVLLTLIGAATASARRPDLGPRLRAADGAFVGRLVKRHGHLLTFRVDVRVKGRLGPRVVVRGPRSVRRGRRVGVILDRRPGRWVAEEIVAPGELLKAAGIGP
jgi:hypothetical protein